MKKNKPKRKWSKWVVPAAFIGGATLLFAYSLDSCLRSKTTEPSKSTLVDVVDKITFEDAKKDVSKRQKYVDQVLLQYGKPPYLVEVVYDHNEKGDTGDDKNDVYRKLEIPGAMFTGAIKGTFKDIGKNKLSIRTRVARMVFDNGSEEFFMMGLFSHERTIAKCLYRGFSKVPMSTIFYYEKNGKEKVCTNLLTLLLELEACSADIKFCRENKVSKELTDNCIKSYKKYYESLEFFRDVPDELRSKIDHAIKAYKRDDL